MDAKEKAENLIDKYYNLPFVMCIEDAEELALIQVNEMLSELRDLPRIPYNERRVKYWEEIKQEIPTR